MRKVELSKLFHSCRNYSLPKLAHFLRHNVVPNWLSRELLVLKWKLTLMIIINVKNFHGSLTTVARAQNDTSKTANISVLILRIEHYTRPYQQSHAKMESKILKPC